VAPYYPQVKSRVLSWTPVVLKIWLVVLSFATSSYLRAFLVTVDHVTLWKISENAVFPTWNLSTVYSAGHIFTLQV
jgi:hypothetical protein